MGKGTGLVIIVNAGNPPPKAHFAAGRLIHQGTGITPVDAQMKKACTGMPVSFEYLKEKTLTGCSRLTPQRGHRRRRPPKTC